METGVPSSSPKLMFMEKGRSTCGAPISVSNSKDSPVCETNSQVLMPAPVRTVILPVFPWFAR